ncbi:MAG: T9SS type A sorting domain-containing protein, partial [Candidatus Cloacimonetes bacterium]|nr:T9SS type A sorting domain-containing protein [Candidatus Cloacimonadota bacterium]
TVHLLLAVGTVTVTSPLGPDAYGYYCYDDGDTGFIDCPEYDWIEINPSIGGEGINLNFYDPGNTGVSTTIDLPFTFRFYGIDYNEITICSNGWIAPGETDIISHMNWVIPGPGGPSPIIAAFWDDLITGSGDVFYYADYNNHTFIVEWYDLDNEYNNAPETFQVIIYDAAFYPTLTGDGRIKIQYKVVNNVDVGSYSGGWYVAHGQYATVGIEDHAGLQGLQYTFNNSYPTAARTLQNEMAILFTTASIPQDQPFLALGELQINDSNDDGNPDYGEDIQLGISLANLGFNPATGISAILTATDPYLEISQNFSTYNDIEGGDAALNNDYFEFSIAENCPDDHTAYFTLSVTSNENSWELFFNLTLYAPVIELDHYYINDGNNNILDPGETSDVLIFYQNTGGAAAYDVNLTLSCNDTLLILNTNSCDFGLFPAGNTEIGIFNFSVDPLAPVGHSCPVEWTITGDLGYQSSGIINFVVSQVPVLIYENFSIFPPSGWSITGSENWEQGPGSYAGGNAPEAQFNWYPSLIGDHRLITMSINTIGSTALNLQFRHMVDHFSGSYTLHVETTSDGINWHDIVSYPPGDRPATLENLTIETVDVGAEEFRLSFTYSGDSYNIDHWYIDDVSIESVNTVPYGYLAGTVQLDQGPGNLQEVLITVDDNSINPDENGNYLLSLIPGTYDLTASLYGYGEISVAGIIINALETTELDLNMNYLPAPESLSAEVNENDVVLCWEQPLRSSLPVFLKKSVTPVISRRINVKADADNDPGNREQTGYRVYRNDNLIATISDTTQTCYFDENLANGEYFYMVTALYSNGESYPSNTVEVIIDFTGNDNNIIVPLYTALLGNHPNPFNPDTYIQFQLAEEQKVYLAVYNLRGQMIKIITDTALSSGYYSYLWNGTDQAGRKVSSGIYLFRMQTETYHSTKKMLLLK